MQKSNKTIKINYFMLCSQIVYHEMNICQTLSHRLPLIDNMSLRHSVGKYVCMCLIDDLKSW